MKSHVTFQQALQDPDLFAHVLQGESWANWRAVLKALNCEALSQDELEIFRRLSGRYRPPSSITEALMLFGRRAGKDFAIATYADYLATVPDYSDVLSPGEVGTVLILAPDLRQSRATMKYCLGILEACPKLSESIDNATLDLIELKSGICIEARAASFKRIRGVTAIAILANECAFWSSDDGSANPDSEILNAARPMLATTGGPLLAFSSPYAKRGYAYETYQKSYGPNGAEDILVFKAPTRTMNPTISQDIVDRAVERDPEMASAEYLAEFRSDISTFIDREVVESLVVKGIAERPYQEGVEYTCGVDPSGGVADSFTLGISHRDADGVAVLDVVREIVPPFSPEATVSELAKTIKNYRIRKVTGDAYAGLWPREQFEKHNISYEVSGRNRSVIYQEFLPLANSRKVSLLDNRRLVNQLSSLERRTGRTGRDAINHPQGGHDDVCNSSALSLLLAAEQRKAQPILISTFEYC